MVAATNVLMRTRRAFEKYLLIQIDLIVLQKKLIIHVTVKLEFSQGFYFRENSRMRNFAKLKPSQNGENYLSLTDVGKSCQSREF